MDCLTYSVPKSRLIVHRGQFGVNDSDDKEPALERTISGHALNNQVEIFFPCKRALLDQKTVSKSLSSVFFYNVKGALSQLLEPEFLAKHVQKGSLVGLTSRAQIDHCNSAAFLPNGVLLLSMDRDTYEQLGLVGRPTQLSKLTGKQKPQRFNVRVDMRAASFAPGHKQYDRVVWCLKDRVPPTELVMAWTDDAGVCGEITFPAGVSSQLVRSAVSEHTFTDIRVPALERLEERVPVLTPPGPGPDQAVAQAVAQAQAAAQAHSEMQRAVENVRVSELFDWLGLMACRLERCLADPSGGTNPFVNSFGPKELALVQGTGFSIRATGLLTASLVRSALAQARAAVDERKCPWAALLVWGFADTPESWTNREHDVTWTGSGENDYTIIVLPQGRFIAYKAVASTDQTR